MKSRTSIRGATMAKPPDVGPSQALEEAEVSVPGIAAALMSRDMPVADAAMTAALLQRLEKRDREKAGATSVVLEIDPEDLPIPLPSLRKGQRFREIAELRRVTQEWALAEWNAGSQRPPWRRDGALAMVVHPGPAQPEFFAYLSAKGLARVQRFSEMDARLLEAERVAVRLMQDLGAWLKHAKEVVAELRPDDRLGPGAQTLRSVYEDASTRGPAGSSWVPTIEEKTARFIGSRLKRKDWTRTMIVWQVERLIEKKQGKATTRDFALASILCGLFPEGIKLVAKGVTAAEVIDAEVRAMRQAKKRLDAEQRRTGMPQGKPRGKPGRRPLNRSLGHQG